MENVGEKNRRKMQLLLDSATKLNLLCNQATFDFSKALLSAVEAKNLLLEAAATTTKPLIEEPKSNQSALDKCVEIEISSTSKDRPKEDVGDKPMVGTAVTGKAQMAELFESLAAIRSNLQNKQRSQSKLGDLVAKTTSKVTPFTANQSSSVAAASYPSLFSQKMGPKAFPTLSKLDSRPSFKPAISTVSTELPSHSAKVVATQSSVINYGKEEAGPSTIDPVELQACNENSASESLLQNVSSGVSGHLSQPHKEPCTMEDVKNSRAVDVLDIPYSPDPIIGAASAKEETQEAEIYEVSMELDTPPILETNPIVSRSEVVNETVLANVYQGNATTFLPPSSKSQQDDVPKMGPHSSFSSKPVHTFVPVVTAVKDAQRPKPVIHALKAAELAAKKEKEERVKRLKEKEARKLVMEKKKEYGGHSALGPIKRPYPISQDEGPKKKSAHTVSQQKSAHHATSVGTSFKPKLPVAETKVKAPLLSHISASSQQGVKNPMLAAFTHKPLVPPKIQQLQQSVMPGPYTIVDTKTGEIMGLNQDSSSDSEASPAVSQQKPPIPGWAQSPHLRQALYNQKKVNPDDIFSGMEAPNLKEILGNTGKMSLGIFEVMEELSTKEQEEYKEAMGFE